MRLMLGMAIAIVTLNGCSKSQEETGREVMEAKLAQLEQAARQEDYDRRRRAKTGARALKPMMRDPSSFSGIAVVTGPGDTCYSYRARNGFGGLSAGRAILIVEESTPINDNDERFEPLWQERCEGRGGQEVALK